MEKIRTLIVDDEPLAREGIRMQLAQEADIQVIGECRNGRQAIAAIEQEAPDLVFLDVQMPKLDGFDVITAIGAKHMPPVIFVTAYDEYALRAFNVHALDYLLKPIDDDRFLEALSRARNRLHGSGLDAVNAQLRALMAGLNTEKKYLQRLSIKSGGRIVFLNVNEIDWIEAAGNYVRIHTGRVSYLHNTTLSRLEGRLDPDHFLRIHRSTIVNLNHVKELHSMFHGEYRILLKDGVELSSSRSYHSKLQRLLGNSI